MSNPNDPDVIIDAQVNLATVRAEWVKLRTEMQKGVDVPVRYVGGKPGGGRRGGGTAPDMSDPTFAADQAVAVQRAYARKMKQWQDRQADVANGSLLPKPPPIPPSAAAMPSGAAASARVARAPDADGDNFKRIMGLRRQAEAAERQAARAKTPFQQQAAADVARQARGAYNSAMGIGGAGMPPPLPAGAAPNAGGGIGNALLSRFGLGGMAGGSGGLAGAAGAAGIAGAIVLSVKNVTAMIGKYTDAVGQAAKAMVSGSPSGALHAGVTAAQAGAMGLGPIIGPVVSDLVGSIHGVIDGMDGMVNSLGQYSAKVSTESGKLELMQSVFSQHMAKATEPMMVAWVQMQQKVLAVMDSVIPKLQPLVDGAASLFGNLGDAAMGLVPLFDALGPSIAGVLKICDLMINSSPVLQGLAYLGRKQAEQMKKDDENSLLNFKGNSLGWASSLAGGAMGGAAGRAMPGAIYTGGAGDGTRPRETQEQYLARQKFMAAHGRAIDDTFGLENELLNKKGGGTSTGVSATSPAPRFMHATIHEPKQIFNFTAEMKMAADREVHERIMEMSEKVSRVISSAREEAFMMLSMVSSRAIGVV